MKRWSKVLAVGCLVGLAGCGGGEEGGARGIAFDTLPNGAVHVRSPEQGLWRAGEGWRLEEEVRIGAVEGEGPDVFGSWVLLAVDDGGRIQVADVDASEIRVFAADGRHLRTVGRRGAGPGEFGRIGGIAAAPGGSLWVLDEGNARFAVHDSAGAFVATHPRSVSFMQFPWPGGIDREGRIYDFDAVGRRGNDILPGLIRLDAALQPTDTFRIPAFEPEAFTMRDASGLLRAAAHVPFTPVQALALAPDGDVWVGTGERYRLHRIRFGGDTARIVERVFTPLPVEARERQEALDRLQGFVRAGGQVDAGRIPATKPAFFATVTDDADHLWVAIPTAAGEPPAWDVFDPEGRFLGAVRFPAPVEPRGRPVIRGDRLILAVADEMDVISVAAYRIVGRSR